jgi:hypothetical protein
MGLFISLPLFLFKEWTESDLADEVANWVVGCFDFGEDFFDVVGLGKFDGST